MARRVCLLAFIVALSSLATAISAGPKTTVAISRDNDPNSATGGQVDKGDVLFANVPADAWNCGIAIVFSQRAHPAEGGPGPWVEQGSHLFDVNPTNGSVEFEFTMNGNIPPNSFDDGLYEATLTYTVSAPGGGFVEKRVTQTKLFTIEPAH